MTVSHSEADASGLCTVRCLEDSFWRGLHFPSPLRNLDAMKGLLILLALTAMLKVQAACVVSYDGLMRCDDAATAQQQPWIGGQSTASLDQQHQQYLAQQAQYLAQQQQRLFWQQQQAPMGQTGFGPFAGQMPAVPLFQQQVLQTQPQPVIPSVPLLNPVRQQPVFAPVIQTAQATVLSAPAAVAQQSCQQIFASGAIEWSALASCPAAPIGSTTGFNTNDAAAAEAPEHDFEAVRWASARGWSMRLVSARDRNKELKDPLDFLALLQEDVHVHPSVATPLRGDWIEVEIDDAAAAAAATDFSTQGLPLADEWAVKAAADQVFDAEHSEFEAAGSGWSEQTRAGSSNHARGNDSELTAL